MLKQIFKLTPDQYENLYKGNLVTSTDGNTTLQMNITTYALTVNGGATPLTRTEYTIEVSDKYLDADVVDEMFEDVDSIASLDDIRSLFTNPVSNGSITLAQVAPAYNPSEKYNKHEIISKGGKLLKAKTPIIIPETFDPNKWEETTLLEATAKQNNLRDAGQETTFFDKGGVRMISNTNYSRNILYANSVLEYVDLPYCSMIYSFPFYACASLKSAFLNACTTATAQLFSSCSNLQRVDLNALQTLGTYAFANCSKLSIVNILTDSVPAVYARSGNNIFSQTPLNSTAYLGYYGSIYVKASLLNSFKTAAYWSAYSSRFVGV